MPIFVFSDDPRGIAFLDDSARFVGRDARSSSPSATSCRQSQAQLQRYFESLGPAAIRRASAAAAATKVELAIVPARGLTRAFPVPYPLGRR